MKTSEILSSIVSSIEQLPRESLLSVISGYSIDKGLKDSLLSYYGDIKYVQDHELCNTINHHRSNDRIYIDNEFYDLEEVSYLIDAYRSPQYYRFFSHIIRSYSRNIFMVSDNKNHNCCICYNNSTEVLYSSDLSATCMCKRCITELFSMVKFLTIVNDSRVIGLLSNNP